METNLINQIKEKFTQYVSVQQVFYSLGVHNSWKFINQKGLKNIQILEMDIDKNLRVLKADTPLVLDSTLNSELSVVII